MGAGALSGTDFPVFPSRSHERATIRAEKNSRRMSRSVWSARYARAFRQPGIQSAGIPRTPNASRGSEIFALLMIRLPRTVQFQQLFVRLSNLLQPELQRQLARSLRRRYRFVET